MQPDDDEDEAVPGESPLPPAAPAAPSPMPFPALLSDDEIEERLAPEPAAPVRRYQPIAVIRERYPHVAERLSLFWGTPEFDAVVASYTVDETGRRAGFPPPVLEAILALARVHRAGAETASRGIDVWITESTRRGLR